MTSFKITKTVAEKKLGDDFVSLAGGELFTSFDSYPLDLTTGNFQFHEFFFSFIISRIFFKVFKFHEKKIVYNFTKFSLSETIYFKAPKQYSYNQMASYGGQLDYLIRYSGYEMGKKDIQ